MLARMLVNKILMDNGQLDRQLRQRDRVYKHNVLKDSYSRYVVFPHLLFSWVSCPGWVCPGWGWPGGAGRGTRACRSCSGRCGAWSPSASGTSPQTPRAAPPAGESPGSCPAAPRVTLTVTCHTVTCHTVTCHTCPAAHLSSRCGMTTPLLTTCITSCRIPEKNLACQNVKNRYSL